MCEFTQTGGKKDEEKRDFKTGIPEGLTDIGTFEIRLLQVCPEQRRELVK